MDMETAKTREVESWRKMQSIELAMLVKRVKDNIRGRWELGNERYDSKANGFQGDPVKHAWDEVMDLVTYLEYTRRKIESLEARIAELEGGS